MSDPTISLDFLKKGVAQVAIVVKDLDEAVDNYRRLFGIEPWHFYTYDKNILSRMTRHGKPTDYSIRIALSYFGPMRIELIEQIHGDTVHQEFIDKHGYGVHHLGIVVDDIDAALKDAEAAGLRMTMDGAGFGADGDGRYAYLDTEELIGTTIELISRPKGRRPPEKIVPPPHDPLP